MHNWTYKYKGNRKEHTKNQGYWKNLHAQVFLSSGGGGEPLSLRVESTLKLKDSPPCDVLEVSARSTFLLFESCLLSSKEKITTTLLVFRNQDSEHKANQFIPDKWQLNLPYLAGRALCRGIPSDFSSSHYFISFIEHITSFYRKKVIFYSNTTLSSWNCSISMYSKATCCQQGISTNTFGKRKGGCSPDFRDRNK